jgi:hypothetical protein
VALEGEQDQVRVTFQVEQLHDVVLVKHDRLLADLENIRDFFHGTTFGKQLNHFLLPSRQIF